MSAERIDAPNLVGPDATPGQGHLYAEKLFDRMNRFEAPFVRWVVLKSQRRSLQRACLIVNRLGNGWIYLAIVAILLALRGADAWRPIVNATGSAAVAFAGYYMIKPYFRRLRPYDLDPGLPLSVKALDTYSFPSGHCMTFCAVGVVLASTYPYSGPAVFLGLILMAWASLALAHHHGTDVIVGVVMGSAISLGICHFIP